MQPALTRRELVLSAATLVADASGGSTVALSKSYQAQLYTGPDSAKSNVSPDAGRYYHATDTDVIYYGDGSGWQAFDIGVGHVWLGQQTSAPSDSEIGSGNTALYSKGDGNIYKRPYGGTEAQVGGGGGAALTVEDDGTQLSSDAKRLNIDAGIGVVEPADDEFRTFTQQIETVTSGVTAGMQDVILADASAGALDVTLQSPSTDLHVTVKKIDSSSNAVGIVPPGSETIDGQSRVDLTVQYASRTLVSDGTNYFIAR